MSSSVLNFQVFGHYFIALAHSVAMSATTVRLQESTREALESHKIEVYGTTRIPNDVAIAQLLEDSEGNNE